MKITSKGRYALRVMIDLAENGGDTPLSLRAAAERQDIPLKYLEQIVSRLVEAELLVGTRGNCGGYRLARSAKNITARQILVAAERDNTSSVGDEENKKAAAFWEGFEKAQNDYADAQTLEDIVNGGRSGANRDPSIWIL